MWNTECHRALAAYGLSYTYMMMKILYVNTVSQHAIEKPVKWPRPNSALVFEHTGTKKCRYIFFLSHYYRWEIALLRETFFVASLWGTRNVHCNWREKKISLQFSVSIKVAAEINSYFKDALPRF